jgi:signal transduction histidine kinase
MRKVELGAYLADCVAELAPDYPSLAIELSAPDGPYPATMDPLRMKRVVTNIVQNAAAYAGRADARLRIGLSREGSAALIRFTDNGPGLGEGEFELVFERFRRLDPSRGRGGAGLGLSIARLIVMAHGGSIRAESAAEGGACFAIRLPLASL